MATRTTPPFFALLLLGAVACSAGRKSATKAAPEAPSADCTSNQESIPAPETSGLPSLRLDAPWDRAVFQRDVQGWSRVPIAVALPDGLVGTKLVAHLAPIRPEQDQDIGWRVISEGSGGEFAGHLEAPGGWYSLSIAVLSDDVPVAAVNVPHVGVGEVLYIAGQSNAQGWGGAAATDDRANVAVYESRTWKTPDTNDEVTEPSVSSVSDPKFAHLESTIGPKAGGGPYYWGMFADRLVSKLQVPVMLFNAAWGGTAVQQWAASAQGDPVYNQIEDLPYGHLKTALTDWLPLLGARAVLWHQGEANATWATDELDYAGDLRTVITQTRLDAGHQFLSWMVARVSLDQSPAQIERDPDWNSAAKRMAVIDAQNEVIESDPGVFPGPDTDLIGEDVRPDGVHLSSSDAQELAAQAWTNAFTDDFLSNSKPALPR